MRPFFSFTFTSSGAIMIQIIVYQHEADKYTKESEVK